jgi:peptidoglycan-associated lipoprotein
VTRWPAWSHTLYFDLDSYTVKAEYQPMLQQHARYLSKQPQIQLLIQGSADERGSREYNLALGQKRAEAIKKALHLLGVSERQMEATSIGEEQPVCAEQTESCWARNRKGELLYIGQKTNKQTPSS